MGIDDLETVINEMDVQDRYRVALRKKFKDIIFESKYLTDGIAYSQKHNLRMLNEHKYRYNFTNVYERAKAISQVIRYVKTIHDSDPTYVPKVALVGDENECFVLPVKNIINYIAQDYEWELSASSMYKDVTLINDLVNDDVIKELYIFNPNNEFDGITNKILQINRGVSVPRTLTSKNIYKVYEYFTDKITLKKNGKKIGSNDSVNLFAHIMLHPDSVMLNEKTKQLFTGMFKEPLTISDINAYKSFTSEFSRKYTPKQKHFFTAILDRLIEDTTRRKQGEFFTPTLWVDKAHEYIASVYGEDWKEKYVVWDPAWGTGNLTRDYQFKELYVSTLNQSDIDTANQMGYNPEATKFQYDFLNDDYEKLPEGIRNAIEEGRQIIVLMNPPYATSNNMGTKKGDHKAGTSNTKVSSDMKSQQWGKSVRNIYSQFFFRVYQMNGQNNIHLCVFCKPNYYTASDYKPFREFFFKKFEHSKGFIFQASEFDDVSKDWGITFSVLKSRT